MTKPRYNHDDRRASILEAAYRAAGELGFNQISSQRVARAAGCSEALVRYHFDQTELRRAVMALAVQKEDLAILVQGLALRHPEALKASAALRERAARTLL